jgi:hypothetical protein
MHNKIVSPAGWPFHTPIAATMKLGRDGRFGGGNDRGSFLKRGSHQFLSLLDQIKIAADEVPLHVIALGATEKWGANRNGDGFLCGTCRDNCHTFKTARWYYNHVHHDPKNSYGVIKAALFNEDMARVELIVALNASKSAADRNEGKIADKTLRLVGEGKPVAVSMGCRINYDVCSACGNKARTRKYYCDEDKCAGGGCKHNLGKLVKIGGDTHHMHVDNPHPVWYDISDVSDTRPADRTAYGSLADWMSKAAACEGYAEGYTGSQAAELVGMAATIWDTPHPAATELEKTAIAIARAQYTPLAGSVYTAIKAANESRVEDVFSQVRSGLPHGALVIDVLSAMAKQGAILPLRAFAKLGNHSSAVVAEAAKYVPAAQEKTAMEIEDLLPKMGSWVCKDTHLQLTSKAAGILDRHYGLTQDGIRKRAAAAYGQQDTVAKVSPIDENSVSSFAKELAQQYAVYKTSAVALAPRVDFALTARLAAGQNLVL